MRDLYRTNYSRTYVGLTAGGWERDRLIFNDIVVEINLRWRRMRQQFYSMMIDHAVDVSATRFCEIHYNNNSAPLSYEAVKISDLDKFAQSHIMLKLAL